ncbi:MAG: hypothetical protein EOP04_04290 [Proteobacteria bacterium]|nr:MAG: hypothetical protein EOP04_04290 [Pseudomonadota bacterium]
MEKKVMKPNKKIKQIKTSKSSKSKKNTIKTAAPAHDPNATSHRKNILSGKKRREHQEKNEYFDAFVNTISKIDQKKKPTITLLKQSRKKYVAKYRAYYSAIAKECEKAKRWSGLAPIKKIEEGRPYDAKGNLIPLATARRSLSELRERIKELPYNNDLTAIELLELGEKYPEYAGEFKKMANLTGEELSKAINTLRGPGGSKVSEKMNKDLKKLKPSHPAMYGLRLTQHQRQVHTVAYKESLAKRHEKAVKINIPTIVQIAEFSVENRRTVTWEALVCAVSVLTGRRPIEVIKTGVFEPSKKPQHLKFQGQAKLHDLSPERDAYEIPVIGSKSPKEVIESVAILRAKRPQYEDRTNKDINNTTAKTLNLIARQLYENENLEFKAFRSVYGLVAEKTMYEDSKGERSVDKFRSDIFGHQDINTQTIYGAIQADWTPTKWKSPAINIFEPQEDQVSEAIRTLKNRVEEAKDRIIALQKRGDAQERLLEFVLEHLNKGEFVTKTRMERPDGGRNSVRSRKIINAFISELKGGWPNKIEELFT